MDSLSEEVINDIRRVQFLISINRILSNSLQRYRAANKIRSFIIKYIENWRFPIFPDDNSRMFVFNRGSNLWGLQHFHFHQDMHIYGSNFGTVYNNPDFPLFWFSNSDDRHTYIVELGRKVIDDKKIIGGYSEEDLQNHGKVKRLMNEYAGKMLDEFIKAKIPFRDVYYDAIDVLPKDQHQIDEDWIVGTPADRLTKQRKKPLKKESTQLKKTPSLPVEPLAEGGGGAIVSKLPVEVRSKVKPKVSTKVIHPVGGYSKSDQTRYHQTREEGGGGMQTAESLKKVLYQGRRRTPLVLSANASQMLEKFRSNKFEGIKIRHVSDFLRECGYKFEGITKHALYIDRLADPPHKINMISHGGTIAPGTLKQILESMGIVLL